MPQEEPKTHIGTLGAVRILGVPVRPHFTFLLLLAFLLFIGVSDRQSGLTTALYVLGLFASVLLHELGHSLMARRYGIRTLEIVMYPIGGISQLERAPQPREELWVALAGPLVNALIAVALFGIATARGGMVPWHLLREPTDANLIQRIAFGNLLLFAFNLLPAYPMDGGRILRALLAFKMPLDEATQMAARAGRGLAMAMGLAGLLAGEFLLVFIAMFVFIGAAQEGASARNRMLTSGFPVSSAMVTDFRTLTHGATIREAGDLLLATSQHDFPVMLGDTVIGLLGRAALIRGMLQEGPEAYVSSVMDRDFLTISPGMSLSEAAALLNPAKSCALVLSDEHLMGMLTLENLSEFLLLRQVSLAQSKNRHDG